jgi:hypothetical protein
MPRITIQVSRPVGESGIAMLSERVTAANLASEHYVAQLVDREAGADGVILAPWRDRTGVSRSSSSSSGSRSRSPSLSR